MREKSVREVRIGREKGEQLMIIIREKSGGGECRKEGKDDLDRGERAGG